MSEHHTPSLPSEGADLLCETLLAEGMGLYLSSPSASDMHFVATYPTNAILHGENNAVGAGAPGVNARRMFDLDSPPLDCVQWAQGQGVEAAGADSSQAHKGVLAAAPKRQGPFSIQAVI